MTGGSGSLIIPKESNKEVKIPRFGRLAAKTSLRFALITAGILSGFGSSSTGFLAGVGVVQMSCSCSDGIFLLMMIFNADADADGKTCSGVAPISA